MHGLDAHLRAQDQVRVLAGVVRVFANNTAHTSALQALTALTAQLATMQSALQDVSRRLRSDQ